MVLGWLWGSSSSNDSIGSLDPSLQKVLKSQEARPSSLPQSEKQITYTEQLRQSGDLPLPKAPEAPQAQERSKVPAQSLYQDGRYAYLWKNYEPQHMVESRGETEMDKLKRLDDDNEDRKVKLAKAALENCVFEQLAELDCLKNGGVHRKLTMCRPEKKTFNRCYEMQGKFLKALGYWEAIGDENRADALQMHSDKLWQRLQEQEAAVQAARDAGEPLPQFESILSPSNVQAIGGKLPRPPEQRQQQSSSSVAANTTDPKYPFPSVPQELRETFDKRIKDMAQDEAKIEEAVFLAETEQKRRVVLEGAGYLRAEGEARRKRFEAGEASIGDRIKRLTNWDAWETTFPSPADVKTRQRTAQAEAAEAKR
jgi:hypothetical protein